jgi:phage terminase large subunit-like protein
MIQELNQEEYTAAKECVIVRLRALREDAALWLAIDDTDRKIGGARLREYFENCIDSPDTHNLYELLALPRFASNVSNYVYLAEMAARVIRCAEALPQPSAKGRVFVHLSPVQVFQYASIYGFYHRNCKRLVREALLFVPRKYGKTTTAANMALYEILFGDADAEAYITSNSLEQSRICFSMVRKIVKTLNRKKCFREVAETIEVKLPGRESKVRCLADNPRLLDGLKASLNVNDESSQAVSFATKNVVTTSMGPRENPLVVDITTASDLVEGPFVDQLNHFKAILRGEIVDDSVFAHVFQPDLGDSEADAATWRKVNPHIGVTVDVDFYAAEYKKAQRSYENMIAFRTKLLNVFVCGTAKSWITSDEIWARFRAWDITKQNIHNKMYYATCSFDLSIRDDFSAVTYIVWLPEERTMHSHTDYYLPRATLERHSNSELYRKWVDDGYLNIMEGDVIDYSRIVQDILMRNEQVALTAIGYDAYKNSEVTASLRNSGAAKVLKAVPQVRSAFTSPTDIMELAVSRAKITFTPNPITAWCFTNAVIDEDNNGNRKPMKKYSNSPMKIDGVITNLMCLKLWSEKDLQIFG